MNKPPGALKPSKAELGDAISACPGAGRCRSGVLASSVSGIASYQGDPQPSMPQQLFGGPGIACVDREERRTSGALTLRWRLIGAEDRGMLEPRDMSWQQPIDLDGRTAGNKSEAERRSDQPCGPKP